VQGRSDAPEEIGLWGRFEAECAKDVIDGVENARTRVGQRSVEIEQNVYWPQEGRLIDAKLIIA